MSQTFTVTLDGTIIGKRTSQTRTYTHALVVLPATDADRRAAYLRSAQEHTEAAAKMEDLAAYGKAKIRDRRLGINRGVDYFHSHEVFIEGTQEAHHANCEGHIETWAEYAEGLTPIRPTQIDHSGRQMYAYKGSDFARLTLRERAKSRREEAVKHAAAADLSDTVNPFVARWSSRADLAEKARSEFDYQVTGSGRRLIVVPVD